MSELERDKSKIDSSYSARYIIESKLGAGGMGAVYKGYDKILLKPVAIKVLLPNSQNEAVIRFHQEAKMAARLHHANILNVLDFGQNEEGDLYLVMDYLEGESLQERLKKSAGGALRLQEALSIFLQICSGLQHAHTQGILHRDIKPSNIMLVKDERGLVQVKIVDFGLAKFKGSEQSLTTTGMRVGSPLYMSPEQAQTDDIDHRSDLYSLGCLMYKTLTGKVPLSGDTLLVTLDKHVNEIPKSINEVGKLQFPNELADIVAKTLEKDPDMRYQSAEALAEALRSLDLSFLTVPLPAVKETSEQSALANKAATKKMFGAHKKTLIVSVLATILCIALTGSALLTFFTTKTVSSDSKVSEPNILLDTTIGDLMNDKLVTWRGEVNAHEDFGDQDTNQLVPFCKNPQLSLANSKVTGSRFSFLKKWKHLKNLNLSHTKIDDNSLIHVGKCKTIKILNLDENQIGDIGIAHLKKLKDLEELHLAGTLVSDLGLEQLKDMSSLQALDLSKCKNLTGASMDVLSQMSNLKQVKLVDCPGIARTDIDRFKSANSTCYVLLEDPNKIAEKKKGEEEQTPEQTERTRKKREYRAWRIFTTYREDMRTPEFRNFFQQRKDCWKPRKSYGDIKNPRIAACLKDPQMKDLMKDPELQMKFRKPDFWHDMDERDKHIGDLIEHF